MNPFPTFVVTKPQYFELLLEITELSCFGRNLHIKQEYTEQAVRESIIGSVSVKSSGGVDKYIRQSICLSVWCEVFGVWKSKVSILVCPYWSVSQASFSHLVLYPEWSAVCNTGLAHTGLPIPWSWVTRVVQGQPERAWPCHRCLAPAGGGQLSAIEQ
ncbi:hypothetical protein E2C01_004499 [Portunus trituberculatus]|uniref:Uncharacterized protein n=1 Tax=Portunus trituberculatus TaxID=210409 RepID=A0A5B7CRI9_PORTR|nr:hypothetical protein [Portunus trituberculatus]